jgi:hypothetical protein
VSSFFCGLWPARTGLVAVVVDEDGRPELPRFLSRTDEAYSALFHYLHATIALDCDLVLPDGLARHEGFSRLALAHGMLLWVAPSTLVEAVRIVGRLGKGPPARTAAALARLPLAPPLRAYLRRVVPPDHRQLSLL